MALEAALSSRRGFSRRQQRFGLRQSLSRERDFGEEQRVATKRGGFNHDEVYTRISKKRHVTQSLFPSAKEL